MKIIFTMLTLLFTGFASTTGSEDQRELGALIDRLGATPATRDYDFLFDLSPEPLQRRMAEEFGVTLEQHRAVTLRELAVAYALINSSVFTPDWSSLELREKGGLLYGFLDYTVMTTLVAGDRHVLEGTYFVLKDGDSWFLINGFLFDPFVLDVYPELR